MFHVKQSKFSLEDIFSECGWGESHNPTQIKERLELYLDLIRQWNQAVNLVGKSTLKNGWQRHILDSAQLLPFIYSLDQKKTVLDIGSGAGLPGIVLAIMGDCKVTLVEANARKCRFLEEVAVQTDTTIEVIRARAEELEPWTANVIVSRALAPLSQLLAYSFPFCTESSQCLFLKGEGARQEIEQARNTWNFDVEIFPSKTSCQGTVLRVQHIQMRRRCS
ncbi:MAG: 16S rRNA (guanine(527)-N(7))-methyltransferase RsmG [Pseudomonadota bacterium]